MSRLIDADALKAVFEEKSSEAVCGVELCKAIISRIDEAPTAQPEVAKDTNAPSTDCISRQAAIDALADMHCKSDEDGYVWIIRSDAWARIDALPSAQSEQPSEIQDILNYLDTVLHPIISPEHWSVYSELHDMISMLPTAQSEPSQIARDIATIIENEQDMRVILAQPQRMRGKWICHHEPYTWMGYTFWTCSECGYGEDNNKIRSNFCPNCGADMRGEQNG